MSQTAHSSPTYTPLMSFPPRLTFVYLSYCEYKLVWTCGNAEKASQVLPSFCHLSSTMSVAGPPSLACKSCYNACVEADIEAIREKLARRAMVWVRMAAPCGGLGEEDGLDGDGGRMRTLYISRLIVFRVSYAPEKHPTEGVGVEVRRRYLFLKTGVCISYTTVSQLYPLSRPIPLRGQRRQQRQRSVMAITRWMSQELE